LGTGFSFDIDLRLGAGAFVCGEETALLRSAVGLRGEPRPRPPYPAQCGLYEKPTLLNNVETFANIPVIIRYGAQWFAAMGTESSKGTKVFSVAGKINNTGLVEVPMGTTLREIIFDIGGGIPGERRFKAVQIGGPSGGCLPESLLDVSVDFDTLLSYGAMMGSGGMIVMDERTCMVEVAKYNVEFLAKECCGTCVPCREGLRKLLDILTKICGGTGDNADLEMVESICEALKETSRCGLGKTAANPVLTSLKYFPGEYEEHIAQKRCKAGVCGMGEAK